MIEAIEVKAIMNIGQLAIRLEERRVSRDSLIQQVGRLSQVPSVIISKARRYKKIFRARVEIERRDIARCGTFDFALFIWREFRIEFAGNRCCDFTFNCEYVCKLALVDQRP